MKRVLGRVLVKETHCGVPNLVVAAYDSVDESGVERGATIQSFGRKIASVLTDGTGTFSFAGEDLVFNGNEIRPNLLLTVSAPEDVQSVDRPVPRPPEQLLLYVSAVPRVDAGAEEAFSIRLLQEQLEKFAIPCATPSQKGESVNRMYRAMEDTYALRDGLKELVAPRLRREQQRVDRIRKLAASKVSTLSGIPLHLRNGDLRDNRFFIASRRDLAEQLKPVQDDAINEGLKRLKKFKPSLRLTLTPDDLETLGLTYRSGRLTGSVDPKKLDALSRTLVSGFDLVRFRGLNNPSPDELERKYLSPPGLVLAPAGPEPKEDATGVAVNAVSATAKASTQSVGKPSNRKTRARKG